MTVCNMSIEGGGRAGMVAPDETTFEYVRGRPRAPRGEDFEAAVERWRALPTDPGARFDRRVEIPASELAPMVSWGTNPGMVAPVTGRVPDPASYEDDGDRGVGRARATVHGPGAGHPDRSHRCRPGLPRVVHQRQDRRPEGPQRRSPGAAASATASTRWWCPGSNAVKRQAEAEGPRRRIQGRRVRLAGGWLLDVPRHEPGHPAAWRALRLDVEPQLRGAPGQGRTHAPRQPPDGRRGGPSPATSWTSGSGDFGRQRRTSWQKDTLQRPRD